MKCSVTFRHMKSSEHLRQYAEESLDKIARLLDSDCEADVVLSVERHQNVAHIEFVTDGSLRIRGVDKSQDMHASIDAAVERIIRQVKRYRSKIRDHREASHTHGGRELPHKILSVPEVPAGEAPKVPEIVRTETLVARTMLVEDAVMQMDLMDSDFLIFTNAVSHHVNVVYRLPDGQYGLIEAHAA
jgi:putative sigma-54 modulation protein